MLLLKNIVQFNLVCNLAISYDGELILIKENKILHKKNYRYIYPVAANCSIITDDLNKPYININNKIDDSFYNVFRINNIKNNLISFYKKGDDELEGIYDLNKNKILFETIDYIGVDIFDDFIFSDFENKIFCRNVLTGKTIWSFNFSALSSDKKEESLNTKEFLGIYNSLLWVHLINSDLIAININNGNLTFHIENILKGDKGNNFLDKKNGIIQTLSFDYYAEFNLNTLQFDRFLNPIEEFSNLKIRTSNYYKNDVNLYFCGYENDSKYPNCFGIFNTKKCKIIWHQSSLLNDIEYGYYFNPPQLDGNRIGILDDRGNLFIEQIP